MRPRSLLLFTITALCAACSSGDDGARDASTPFDAELAGDADVVLDAQVVQDTGFAEDAGAGDTSTIVDAGEVELPTTCEGDCAQNGAEILFGAAGGGFDRAFYGISSPAQSSSGDWELHVEVLRGGDEGCPTMGSRTPDWNLIVTLPLLGVAPLSEVDGAVTFLDFTGRLVTGPRPLTRATAFTVTPVAARVCTACVGGAAPSDPDGFVAFTVDARFAEGTIRGSVFATHCDSFDAP
ncbi:hypothetical protein L6R52_01420 [Myxococcota bacterium]|nr:hypothetical protein [Myxococcota bacterium]